MRSDNEIIAKVLERVRDRDRRTDLEPDSADDRLRPLSDWSELERIEVQLGFLLPPLLRRLYVEVGDGGFGPGLGLYGAKSGHWQFFEPLTLADLYASNHKDGWPDRLVPLCDWGCGIRSCVDCASPDYSMVIADPDFMQPESGECPGFICETKRVGLISESISFRDWIEKWADGVNLWDRFERLQQGLG